MTERAPSLLKPREDLGNRGHGQVTLSEQEKKHQIFVMLDPFTIERLDLLSKKHNINRSQMLEEIVNYTFDTIYENGLSIADLKSGRVKSMSKRHKNTKNKKLSHLLKKLMN